MKTNPSSPTSSPGERKPATTWRDELSTGRGSALKRRRLAATGGDQPVAQLTTTVPSTPLRQLQRSVSALPQAVTTAAARFNQAATAGPPIDAVRDLNQSLEALPAAQRQALLAQSSGGLQTLTGRLTPLDGRATTAVVTELARTAELAGPSGSQLLTSPMAKAIASGKLEQTGSDANGGLGGVFRNANRHHSEREVVEALSSLGGGAGPTLLRDSLTASLVSQAKGAPADRAQRALGFAAAVATQDAGLVPDGGVWSRASELGRGPISAIDAAVSRVETARERAADVVIDSTTGLRGGIGELDRGDTLSLGVDGSVSAAGAGKARAGVEVTREHNGTYTVSGEADLLVGLGLLKNDVLAGGGGAVELSFKDAAQAERGARALMRGGDGDFLVSHLAALELDAAALGELDGRYGLTGVSSLGAEGELEGRGTTRVELKNGVPQTLVTRTELAIEGTGEGSGIFGRNGAGGLLSGSTRQQVADKLGVDPAELDSVVGTGSGTLTLENRFDISRPEALGDHPVERLEALIRNPSRLVTGPPVTSARASFEATLNDRATALTFEVNGIQTGAAGSVVDRLRHQDLRGALSASGAQGKLTVSHPTYQSRNWLDHEVDFGVGSVGGTNRIRHEDPDPFTATLKP